MDLAKEHVEYIADTLESHVVTYHTAARDLGIHVSRSKAVLLSYYQTNKTRVAASFIATGLRHDRTVVCMFESEADLTQNLSARFDSVNTVHVYSLLAISSCFTPVDCAIEERKHVTDLANLPAYWSLGLIQGPELKRFLASTKELNIGPNANSSTTHKPQLPPATEPKPSSVTTKDDEKKKPKLVYQSRKQQPKPSIISSYVSRKTENSAASETGSVAQKRSAPEKPLYEYKSRKLEQNQPKERVVVSNMDEDTDAVDEPNEDASSKTKLSESELHNLFLDDFTDDDEKNNGRQDMEVDQPIVVGNTEDEQIEECPEESQANVEQTPSVPDNDIWRSISSVSAKPDTLAATKATPAPETTIDDDGYFTLYKQNEPKPEPIKRQAKPLTAPPRPGKSDGKKKQTSVMSFFSKR